MNEIEQAEVFQPVDYLPYSERTPNVQLESAGGLILQGGRNSWTEDSPQGFKTIKSVGVELRFDMRQGFPIATVRDCLAPIVRRAGKPDEQVLPNMFEQAVGEWAAFANGARTIAEFERYGCYWWDRFLPDDDLAKALGLEPGDNGPGSYGPGFTNFLDTGFNQLEAVIEQMRRYPYLRTHVVTPWMPPLVFRGPGQKVRVAPCHGLMHFMINATAGEMTMDHWQRSGDMFVGVQGGNIMQYAAVGMVVANILRLKFKELVYFISDAHVYDYKDQIAKVQEVIRRAVYDPRPFPTVQLTRNFTALAEMRPEHFEITDYNPHPKLNIPTPI